MYDRLPGELCLSKVGNTVSGGAVTCSPWRSYTANYTRLTTFIRLGLTYIPGAKSLYERGFPRELLLHTLRERVYAHMTI